MSHDKISLNILQENEIIHNFSVNKITPLTDISCTSYEMEHITTGAKLLYLRTDDIENLFSIAFRTPPPDSTGLPHILEHTVLCGSRKFPVKDPFVELLKTSLATFLNAMTYPDKTVYPCASINQEDFHNLIRVYCDAVFNPLITKEHFKQEGHHYKVENISEEETALSIEGVVYNEMKGVYSDLDGIISREESKSLMPETIYANDYGGNPDDIPNLTYRQFKAFHSKYYHPSNSYMIIYGSFDISSTLAIIDGEFLKGYKKKRIRLSLPKQTKWIKPVKRSVLYPVSSDKDLDKKAAVTLNFLTNPLTETLTSLAMSLIEIYLLDNSSSPLKKALMESSLGEALTPSGYGDYQYDTFFTAGMKGINPADADKIEDIIFETCRNEAKIGFNRKKLDAAFHKLFIDSKEIHSSYPLTIMERVYDYFLYGKDPLTLLTLNQHLEKLKELVASNNKYLENILLKYIVTNTHYCRNTFLPDPLYNKNEDMKFEEKMKAKVSSMTKSQLLKIKKEAEKLEELHNMPNSPEALSSLPKLKLSDISRENSDYPVSFVTPEIVFSDIFSNGMCYLDMAFDVTSIKSELFEPLGLFKSIILKMGTSSHSYLEMAELEASCTGGLSSGLCCDGNFDDAPAYKPVLRFTGKALNQDLNKMLDIIQELILECEFKDTRRLKELILQRRTNLRSSILSSGSAYSSMYASRGLSANMYLSELTNGISHLKYLDTIAEDFNKHKDKLIAELYEVKSALTSCGKPVVSFTGSHSNSNLLEQWIKLFGERNNSLNKNHSFPEYPLNECPADSVFLMPSSVSYNASVLKAAEATNTYAPALFLISHFLTYNFLWTEIRAKRGAYGANASYSMLNGIFSFSTYRDPCIAESFRAFKDSLRHIIEHRISDSVLESSIIGSMKKFDKPVRPEEGTSLTLNRILRNISPEQRTKFRHSLLSLQSSEVRDAAMKILLKTEQTARNCTITGKKLFDKASGELSQNLVIETLQNLRISVKLDIYLYFIKTLK